MLRLLLASVALWLTWSWLRAELSRAIEAREAPRKDALIVRGAAFAIALVWLVVSIGGAFGKFIVWGTVFALIGAGLWLALAKLKGGSGGGDESAPPPGDEPPSDASA